MIKGKMVRNTESGRETANILQLGWSIEHMWSGIGEIGRARKIDQDQI